MYRLFLILVLPVLALDCAANVLVGGSFQNTLSGEAWSHRFHPVWGWTHRAINSLFFWQANHCRGAWAREAKHGTAWASWRAKWRAGRPIDSTQGA